MARRKAGPKEPSAPMPRLRGIAREAFRLLLVLLSVLFLPSLIFLALKGGRFERRPPVFLTTCFAMAAAAHAALAYVLVWSPLHWAVRTFLVIWGLFNGVISLWALCVWPLS